MEASKTALEAVKKAFGHVVVGLQELDWEKLPQKTKEHIKSHPKMSTFQILSILLLAVPSLLVGPVLGAVGFSSLGPVAGSAAAAYQSANGATALFSTLQSAAMGGYGLAAVNGVVQGSSAAFAVVTSVWKSIGSKDGRRSEEVTLQPHKEH